MDDIVSIYQTKSRVWNTKQKIGPDITHTLLCISIFFFDSAIFTVCIIYIYTFFFDKGTGAIPLNRGMAVAAPCHHTTICFPHKIFFPSTFLGT
jgi:hypothetical protein